ncbi:MAG TPA: AarF/UbiB family protein [Rugosimonospora sp.]|nr:AarF/UbiB family protein [Rugosimonospora sp.]
MTFWHGSRAAAAALRGRTGREAFPARVERFLVALGPSFVKGGQLLGTRGDLVPPSWCAALGRLHDRVDPLPHERARVALEAAYPAAQDWPFAEYDWSPVASGSIACVYRARLLDGRTVAVKVRRPGIATRMRADFRLLRAGAAVGEWCPGLRGIPARRMVDQIGAAVLAQLDLDHEADALRQMRDNLAGLIQVPQPIPDASGDGVLVMEFVDGLARFGPHEFTPEQRREAVRRVLQGVYRMLFVDGLVHCDMHPGNLYLTRSAEPVLLDAGFVVRLPPEVRGLFAEFFYHMATGHGDECADVVLRSADHVPKARDLSEFREGIKGLIQASHRRPAGEFRLAPFAGRLFDLQRRCGIAAAPEFVFPLLCLLVLEGMILDFDVQVDFQGQAVPTLLKALRERARTPSPGRIS